MSESNIPVRDVHGNLVGTFTVLTVWKNILRFDKFLLCPVRNGLDRTLVEFTISPVPVKEEPRPKTILDSPRTVVLDTETSRKVVIHRQDLIELAGFTEVEIAYQLGFNEPRLIERIEDPFNNTIIFRAWK